jgi:hypothetical protein
MRFSGGKTIPAQAEDSRDGGFVAAFVVFILVSFTAPSSAII